MTAPRYSRLAAKLLVRDERGQAPPVDPEARALAVAAVERAIRERAHRQTRARWLGALSAAAAVALVAVGGWRLAGKAASTSAAAPALVLAAAPRDEVKVVAHANPAGASVFVSGAAAPLADGRALLAGSRIVTPPTGRAELAFSTGTSVVLRGGADATLGGDDVTQLVRLDAGSIELHVAKLAADRRFEVRTPDAEVEVRGTRFTVAIAPPDGECGGGTMTRVVVTEGVVAVRYRGVEARVAAGEQWPAGCVRTASVAAPGTSRRVARVALPAANVERPAPALPSPSTLAEQNDRFAEAVTARRRGDAQGAVAAFDRFLSRYPSSPLVESATVERLRALAALDPSRAASAARAYLAAYSEGFARAEAEAIVAGAR